MVIAFDMLEHIEDYQTAMREVQRVLRVVGKFIVGVPCEGELFALHNLLLRNSNLRFRLHGHLHRLTHAGFQRTLLKSGFQITKSCYAVHWFGQIANILSDILMDIGTYPEKCFMAPKNGKFSQTLAFWPMQFSRDLDILNLTYCANFALMPFLG